MYTERIARRASSLLDAVERVRNPLVSLREEQLQRKPAHRQLWPPSLLLYDLLQHCWQLQLQSSVHAPA
jgi:hypothetical protein